MPKLIDLQGQVLDNPWVFLEKDTAADMAASHESMHLIVPLQLWLSSFESLTGSGKQIAVWLDSDETAGSIADSADKAAFIALNFPGLMDGRAYSTAVALRKHHGFTGEIRAIGDVLRDQLFYMRRCGFSTFDLKDSVKLEDACNGLKDFSTSYASTTEEPLPLFRRKQA